MTQQELKDFDYLIMIDDTCKAASNETVNVLSDAYVAYRTSDALANEVEFWKWLDRNYASGGMFSSNSAMNEYISRGAGKEDWVARQLQGKGYEWDWMSEQRHSLSNIFKQYNAGDVSNRPGTDITEHNILTGESKEYQMKAYSHNSNPNVSNTPHDATVVTNAEKADNVASKGYDVEVFKDSETINEDVERRMGQIKNGTATPSYNWKNVGLTMGKSFGIGLAFGITTEAVVDYKKWKAGTIDTNTYLKNIGKSGFNAGTTSAITSGIMIPVEAAVTAAGLSAPITIPIAIVVGVGVDKFVAPCFGRGDYQKILESATYYRDLERLYYDMAVSIETSTQQFYKNISEWNKQQWTFKAITDNNNAIDAKFKSLKNMI